MLSGKAWEVSMRQGWEFRFGDRVYYVGAPDVEAAKYLVLQHLRSQGDVKPKEIPESVIRFLKLADGTLIEARVFDFNELLDANRT
jgi:hypothetical protein